VHSAQGSYSASKNAYVARSTLPVYQRQLFPERVLGEIAATPEKSGETLYENDGVRLWACLRSTPKLASFPSSRRCTPSATRCWMA
jgi:hypothetical protein